MKRAIAFALLITIIGCFALNAYAALYGVELRCPSCGDIKSGRVTCDNRYVSTSNAYRHTAQNGTTCNYYYQRFSATWRCNDCNNQPSYGNHKHVEIHECEFGARVVCPYGT